MAGQCGFRCTLWPFIHRTLIERPLKLFLILLTSCKSWMKSWENRSQSVDVDYEPGKLKVGRSPKDDW